MPDLTNISEVRKVLERYNFSLKKSLGQNFLINSSVCPRMAESACSDDISGVLEIGPGAGVLTSELAKRAEKVVSIEIDEKLRPVLADTLSDFNNVEIIFGDVMKLDLGAVIKEKFGDGKIAVCANLPYYITSPIIMMLLSSGLPFSSITVMVQKEAADRLCAEMGTRNCGAVTAAVAYYAKPTLLFKVSKGSFMPPPKVDSAVIRLDIRNSPPADVDNEKMFFSVIKAAFAQRRKTLCNALCSGLGIAKDRLNDILRQCSINPAARAEQLTFEQFAQISNAIASGGTK